MIALAYTIFHIGKDAVTISGWGIFWLAFFAILAGR